MSFNGNEGEFVTLSDASRWTANYRNTIQPGDVIAEFQGKEKLLELLNQEGCVGIRFYYAINDEGKKVLVQGIGHVGEVLVQHLTESGALVTIADINEERLNQVGSKYGSKI